MTPEEEACVRLVTSDDLRKHVLPRVRAVGQETAVVVLNVLEPQSMLIAPHLLPGEEWIKVGAISVVCGTVRRSYLKLSCPESPAVVVVVDYGAVVVLDARRIF